MSQKKKEILSQIRYFSSATLLTHLVTAITVYLIRKFLGPTQMGIWSIIQVVLTYSLYSSLGVTY